MFSRSFTLITHPMLRTFLSTIRLHSTISRDLGRMSLDYATVSYITVPNDELAKELASKLIKNRLAACVNIVKGVESVYEWQGKIEQDKELLLIVKSSSEKSECLAKFVVDNHPYDCPEVVTMKIDAGNQKYIQWVRETVVKDRIL